ncbi:MAG: DotU family type IV/VI secretion system protein [Deltaproteobacteria bacterium]|nr:DotU family type IV/VI secretion system protein [Deltaproteobacteria bacterium]
MAEALEEAPSKSTTWFRRGWATLTRAGKISPQAAGQESTSDALRNLFTDLIAYVLFFEAICGEKSPPVSQVREKIVSLISAQEDRVKSGEVASEAYREARFAVLSWVDETIFNSSWPHRGQWQHLMSTYYRTLNAGEEFFRHLDSLPSTAREIREIYFLCLGLGFQGKYAFVDGANQLRELKHLQYRQVASPSDVRQEYRRLFPEAYRKAQAARPAPAPRVHPVWFALAILLPVVLFVSYWLILRRETNRLLAVIEQRPTIAKPVEIDWRRSLVEELRRRGIDARETPRGILVTLGGILFAANKADLAPDAERRIEDLAFAVKRHAPERKVYVEGHASQEKGVAEERNQRLSEDRARKVAETLVRYGLLSEKVSARGFGSSRPVASNDNESGRRQNRRVEILIEN